MATSPSQVLESIDYSGISVVTASKDASVPRQGMIYDPLNLAAATPIYFHDLGENNYLAIFSQRWVNAVQSLSVPGHYTSYTANTTPSWAIVHSVNGTKEPVGGSFVIPMVTKNDSRVVTAACSRMINLLCLLNTVTYAGMNYAVVQTFHCTNNGVVNRLSEETIPNIVADGQTVIFDRCIYLSDPFVIAVGSGKDDHSLYLARKRYATVGSASSPWEYQTSRGWTANADEIQRLMSTDGEVMTTHGPCSAASYRGTICMSTVQADGSARSARLYISNGLQWTPGTSFPLGDAGSSYLGGLYLQPLLGAVSQTSSAGYPFVTSQLSTADGASTITTSWSVSRMTGGVAFDSGSNTTAVSVARPAVLYHSGHFATSLSSTVSISAAATFNIFAPTSVTATLTASMVKNAIDTNTVATVTISATGKKGISIDANQQETLSVTPVLKEAAKAAGSTAVTATTSASGTTTSP